MPQENVWDGGIGRSLQWIVREVRMVREGRIMRRLSLHTETETETETSPGMKTQLVEATNKEQNWGKFLIAQFDDDEWAYNSAIDPLQYAGLLQQRGWAPHHRLVVDLETGEGILISPGGSAHDDLRKHAVWVCPMFEPFLAWWYQKWPAIDVGTFPNVVQLPDAEFQWAGYRREGLLANATQFSFYPPGSDDYHKVIHVVSRGNDTWAITRFGDSQNLNHDGEWEYEPSPSNREDDFLARCRFPLHEAVLLAQQHAAQDV